MDSLISIIDACVERLAAAGLRETAQLLRIARLDLAARINGISEDELAIFSFALQEVLVCAGRTSNGVSQPEIVPGRPAP